MGVVADVGEGWPWRQPGSLCDLAVGWSSWCVALSNKNCQTDLAAVSKKICMTWLMTRRPWCQQGFGQSAAWAECGPPDLPEGGSECYVHRQEPLQWVSFSLYASPVNYFSQSSTPRRLGWMTAPKLATSSRSVSAASASAAWDAATSATANLQMSELMLLLPGNCCPTFRQNTCKCQSFVSANLCLVK